MDALSTPASALGLGGSMSTQSREPLLFRLPSSAHLASPPPRSILSRSHPHPSQPLGASPLRASPFPSDPSRRFPPRRPAAAAGGTSPFHRKASTGYAAALLDAARCERAVAAVEKDVRRFSRAVHAALADPLLGDEGKGEAVLRALAGGGFCRHLVVLVRMLVGKGKVGMVGEVMEEFGRIYDELTGARAVLVSSEGRMGLGQLAGIAERVRRASGAAKVRLRHAYARS